MNIILFYILAEVNYIPYIIVGGGLFVLLVAILIFVFLIKNKRKKVSHREDDWFIALGGKENIKDISAVGSRLSLVLISQDKIDRDQLKTLGVSSILTMSNKVILVIEDRAVKIAAILKSNL